MQLVLAEQGSVRAFADLLAKGWKMKRSLGCGITNSYVDNMYDVAIRSGAWGGKLLGAGGGGFLLLIAAPESHDSIWRALGRPAKLPIRLSRRGGHAIFANV